MKIIKLLLLACLAHTVSFADSEIIKKTNNTSKKGFLKLYEIKNIALDPQNKISDYVSTEEYEFINTVLDTNLDIPSLIKKKEGLIFQSRNAQSPKIVVGQGADKENLSFVRIFNEYGLCKNQFLAFDEDVKGGVGVCSFYDENDNNFIACYPLLSDTKKIRIFTEYGTLKKEINAPSLPTVCAGKFLNSYDGTLLAIAPSVLSFNSKIDIVNQNGEILKSVLIKNFPKDILHLATSGNELIICFVNNPSYAKIDLNSFDKSLVLTKKDVTLLPKEFKGKKIFFANEKILASSNDLEKSSFLLLQEDGKVETIQASFIENQFFTNINQRSKSKNWYAPNDTDYFKNANYQHDRVDYLFVPYYKQIKENPNFISKSAEKFFLSSFPKIFMDQRSVGYTMWEPCFTHRMPHENFTKYWGHQKDEDTLLPKYMALSRLNNTSTYGEFGKIGFVVSTYAYVDEALNGLYFKPLSMYLEILAKSYKATPEMFFSIEPNHEHEIAIEKDESIGDYNPAMVRGFYNYMISFYGKDFIEEFNLPFNEYFDVPRDLNRGSWDKYSFKNAFFKEWVFYNRYIVNRRIAEGFAASIMAGFAPEIIKSHQIPDAYAISSTRAFSDKINRITPIDYTMNGDFGFGFTRYSVWYKKGDVQKAAYDSGFNNMTVGEYNALTVNQKDASNQLEYMFDNGTQSVHCMHWPLDANKDSHKYNKTMSEAAAHIASLNKPRITATGGINDFKFLKHNSEDMLIVCLGSNERNTGLLKSVNLKGDFTGKVYFTPFRTQIATEKLSASKVNQNDIKINLGSLDVKTQIQLSFTSQGEGEIEYSLKNDKTTLDGTVQTIRTSSSEKQVVINLFCQMPILSSNKLNIYLAPQSKNIKITNLKVRKNTDLISKLHNDVAPAKRNKYSVNFDTLK